MHAQDAPCEAVHAERSLWVAHECEPAIWMMLVAQRAWLGGPVRDAALRQSLVRLHALSTLLHGPLQGMLEAVSRRCLFPGATTLTLSHVSLAGVHATIPAR